MGSLYEMISSWSINWSENQLIDKYIHICKIGKSLYKNGFYHRDIKSDNIFIAIKGDSKLGDIGES